MGDKIPLPSVPNLVRQGNFTLHVYAYRTMTQSELRWAVSEYMRRKRLRKLPASGSDRFDCLFGYNPVDDI